MANCMLAVGSRMEQSGTNNVLACGAWSGPEQIMFWIVDLREGAVLAKYLAAP